MDELLIAALRASLGSATALSLFARIEFLLADGPRGCERRELDGLIDEWATEIVDLERCEADRLKQGLCSLAIRRKRLASAR